MMTDHDTFTYLTESGPQTRQVNKLNDLMEFDHVIRVLSDRRVEHALGEYAPSLHDGDLDTDEWTLMSGYSGQDRYSGPLMHASEFIGGGMARDILATPGEYVALVDYPLDDSEPEAWAVAYRPLKGA